MLLRHPDPSDGSRRTTTPVGYGRGAFTIVEVAMAVLVLSTVITSAILVMQRALAELDAARNLDVAGRILKTEIEKERLLEWTQVSDAAYRPVIDASLLGNPAIAGRFTLSRSLVSVAGSGGKLVQATVIVTWRGLDGRGRSRSTTTWFAEGGLNDYLNGDSAGAGTSQSSQGTHAPDTQDS